MSVLPSGFGSSEGYIISRSLRFNSADTAYLSRTPASASNRKTWTWSGWIKRSALGEIQYLFGTSGAAPISGFYFDSNDTLRYRTYNGSVENIQLHTTAVYRDVSAWYHVICTHDTTQSTSSDRLKFYINGVQVTIFTTATYPTLNYDDGINNTVQHELGSYTGSVGNFTGYMTEINFIDGQALTPSSFGQINSNTGVWEPIKYTGTYGTNGFYVNFSDNSGTTATTLGKDQAGSNNWTPNNFSVTAGINNDSMVDVPVSWGSDTGAGGVLRGNYCTLNPTIPSSNATATDGNLKGVCTGSGASGIFSTFRFGGSGKYYVEFTIVATAAGGEYPFMGITSDASGAGGNLSSFNNGYCVRSSGKLDVPGSSNVTYGSSFVANDVCMMAVDLDSSKIWFGKNGTWFASGNPSTGENPATATVSTTVMFTVGISGDSNAAAYINFGQRAFIYTAPANFKSLCTTNLSVPTIGAGSSTQANKYFDILMYTGNGTSPRTLGGLSFSPDFVWIKGRSLVTSHQLTDTVRGAGKAILSSSSAAEEINRSVGYVSAFTSDGFTLTTGVTNMNEVNANTYTYVAWNWKANGSGVTNTDGTLTSTVSVSSASGFSIVTYTGNGVGIQNVGHGLGVAPTLIFIKNRSAIVNWLVFTTVLSNNLDYLVLNDVAGAATAGEPAPTSKVFSVSGTSGNGSGNNLVAYCFTPITGYSSFGKYIGNGSTNGPFVYTGFRPRWLLIKRSSISGNYWIIVDTSRGTYNINDPELYPNAADVETAGNKFDLLSNGFKLRVLDAAVNNSNDTYLYAAFAEAPFKYALAR